jgi:polyribonucleotide nucleotidyltransferase
MLPEAKKYTAIVGGKTITFETGRLAGQAGGAVTLQLGETVMFAAATISPTVRTGIDFFPLSVDYEEQVVVSQVLSSGVKGVLQKKPF